MNHEFDYDNADRKDLLERCKSFEVAMNAQHTLSMSTFKERDTYRDLCMNLLSLLKVYIDNGDVAQHLEFRGAITKAESILGEKNG